MRTTSIIAVVLFIVLMILRSEEVNAAEDIAVCSELKGVEYYHATSMVPENMAGWREAAISNGKTVLKRIEENEYNILFFDQYFGQNLGRPVSDRAIVTKVLVIGAGFFQAMPLG